jgi:hypothetical protein
MPGVFTLPLTLAPRRAVAMTLRHIAEGAGEDVLLLVADQRFPNDLHRQTGKRLLDHAALLDPLQRHVKARIFAIEIERFIAVRGQQFPRAQHGDQFEFERETGLAIPRQVGPVEAVPESPDLVLGKDARAGITVALCGDHRK